MRKRQIILLGLIVFVLKISIVIYLTSLVKCANPERVLGRIAVSSGDTHSYIGAMENYLQTGTYFFDNGKENIYAGRMPHYSVPYFIFRQFLNERNSTDVLVVFQVFIESLAILLTVFMAASITNNHSAIYITVILMILSLNWTNYSYYASPESLSTSLVVAFIWFYIKYLQKKTYINILLVGIILGLLVTLKPYFILLFLPIGIHFLIAHLNQFLDTQGWRRIVKSVIIVSLPMILLLMPWVIRNYKVYKKFVPLQITTTAGYNYTKADWACRRFLQAWGDDILHWEKKSAGCYFIPTDVRCEFQFPSYAFADGYTISDVESIKMKYIELQNNYSKALDENVESAFNELTDIYKKERPFRYYLITPLLFIKKFLVHSGSYYLPIHSSNPCYRNYQFPIKLLQSGLYWSTLLFGIIGLFQIAVRNKIWILLFIPFFLILLFPIVLRAVEWRMFQQSFPVLVIGLVYFIYNRFFNSN